jgi:hypothetical protein
MFVDLASNGSILPSSSVPFDSAVYGARSADNMDMVVKSANTLPGATNSIRESKYCSFEGQDSLLSSTVI